MILEREPMLTTLIMEKMSRKVAIPKEQRCALQTIKVETQKSSKGSQDQIAPTNLEVNNSLIAKERDEREHIMAKRTLKGQNVSTHLTSNLLLSLPPNEL